MRNFSPVSEMRKGQRRVVARNSRNKANTVKHKIITFTPIIALATLIAVSLQLNGMLMMWTIQQAMQDDAEFIRRIHPGTQAEVFIWQNFQPAYRDPGWKNRDIGNRASPLSRMNTSKILQRIQVRRDLGHRASPVNRAHMKRNTKKALKHSKCLSVSLAFFVFHMKRP